MTPGVHSEVTYSQAPLATLLLGFRPSTEVALERLQRDYAYVWGATKGCFHVSVSSPGWFHLEYEWEGRTCSEWADFECESTPFRTLCKLVEETAQTIRQRAYMRSGGGVVLAKSLGRKAKGDLPVRWPGEMREEDLGALGFRRVE